MCIRGHILVSEQMCWHIYSEADAKTLWDMIIFHFTLLRESQCTEQIQNSARFPNTSAQTASQHTRSSLCLVWRLCAFKCCVCILSLQHILIVQRQLSVLEEELEEFRLALRQYMECACAQTGCLQSVYILFVHLCQGFTAFIFILSIFTFL